jgi:Tol biopolymer transport system component
MSLRLFTICVGISFLVSGHAQAYSVPVHVKMSKNAYEQSVLYPANGNYLTTLGLTSNQLIKGKIIEDHIADGSEFEDNGFRAFNHFYDPTTGQGLLSLPNFIATDAINWGLKLQSCLFNPICGTLTQEWSIPDARNYLYAALTDPDSTVRETNWANTFQALGHVIHLIQDMGQPQHVRNDPHYENGNPSLSVFNFDRSRYESFTASRENIDRLSYTGYPVANFSDYIYYWTAGGYGLADVTNRNFFSERIFMVCNGDICAEQGYAEPIISASSAVNQIVEVPTQTDGTKTGVMTFFPYTFVDPLTGEVVTNPRVLSHSFFDFDLLSIGGWPLFSQNKYTFEESQKILVKRAVGYSAGLINYFFRGQLEITPASGGLKVKNLSSEPMGSGFIAVYYDDYTLTRQYLAGYDLPAPLNQGDETPVISFTRPQNNITGRYIVVFQGQLGAEEGAVIGAMTTAPLYYVSKRSGAYKIFRMEADGSNQAVVYDNTNPNFTIGKLAPSPDGKSLAFSINGTGIYLLDLTSHVLSELTQGDWPDWSPDGKKIVFERDVTPDSAYVSGVRLFTEIEIFARNLSTGSETQLTQPSTNNPSTLNRLPAFSPDGRTIAYTKWAPEEVNCPSPFVIYLMDASGNPIGPITCDPQKPWIDEAPAWSPDGHEITFLRRWSNEFDQLYKVSVDTKTITKLTESDGTIYAELTPSWSSDGKVIAIGSNRYGNFDIWLVSSNGGYLNNLTSGNTDIDGFPAYQK